MKSEQWKPLPGFEEIYSVSSLGRVRLEIRRHNILAGTFIKIHENTDGYAQINLRDKHGKQKVHRVHRLIAKAFLGPIPDGLEVNHKNGNKMDPRLENLELVTRSENMRHRLDELGWKPLRGSAHGNSKLDEKTVLEIRHRHAAGESVRALNRAYGVSIVKEIVTGKTWKHVGGPIRKVKSFSGKVTTTKKQVEEAKARAVKGEKYADIAEDYGVTAGTICNWVHGKFRR